MSGLGCVNTGADGSDARRSKLDGDPTSDSRLRCDNGGGVDIAPALAPIPFVGKGLVFKKASSAGSKITVSHCFVKRDCSSLEKCCLLILSGNVINHCASTWLNAYSSRSDGRRLSRLRDLDISPCSTRLDDQEHSVRLAEVDGRGLLAAVRRPLEVVLAPSAIRKRSSVEKYFLLSSELAFVQMHLCSCGQQQRVESMH